MHQSAHRSTKPEPAGLVIHGAGRYDFIVWLFTLGGEKRFRERMLRLARLQPDESVLDIGCGTGTLAILAKRQVGARGIVYGVDASPEMIARAREKARSANVELILKEGAAQNLPFADAEVDVVLSTLMLHHLPRKARPEIVREIKRVLKPGGRFLAVDFAKPAAGRRGFIDRFHRHGFVHLDDVVTELEAAGFGIIRSGPVGERNLQFVLARSGPALNNADDLGEEHSARERSGHGGILLLALAVAGALALIALHAGAGLSARALLTESASGPLGYALAAAVALLVAVKLGAIGLAHRLGAKLLGGSVGAREEGAGRD